MNRREVLGLMGTTAAAGLLLGRSNVASGYPVNETIRIGCIGTGGRCRMLMNTLKKMTGVRVTAICDVWDSALNTAKPLADADALATGDYRAVLDRKDIDAVLIGSPDHWHVPMTVAACEAGKDVYVEKPLTHGLAEGQEVIDAQNRNKRIVQVGMQQRSMPHIIEARKIVQAGTLGRIHKAHLTWNRNAGKMARAPMGVDPKTVDWKAFLGSARDQPFDEYRFRHWRWFWDFGGGILTDLMVHWLDVVHWICEVDHPAEAVTIGDHFAARDLWETPDTIQTLLHYPDRALEVYFEGTFVNARNGAMVELMGTEATLYFDRGRFELHPERGRDIQPREMILGDGPRGADFYAKPDADLLHLSNWVECMRSRKPPCAPAEAGVSAASGAHLGNQAYRSGQTARWKA
ncbi:MAG TPA: Gfo/Idh/MocA family oxidoreductase [Phycisphaerae bacterium]|nr:Gfo/Idh/MocA family oxidoreductase [Phycisphaerae bacterium]